GLDDLGALDRNRVGDLLAAQRNAFDHALAGGGQRLVEVGDATVDGADQLFGTGADGVHQAAAGQRQLCADLVAALGDRVGNTCAGLRQCLVEVGDATVDGADQVL